MFRIIRTRLKFPDLVRRSTPGSGRARHPCNVHLVDYINSCICKFEGGQVQFLSQNLGQSVSIINLATRRRELPDLTDGRSHLGHKYARNCRQRVREADAEEHQTVNHLTTVHLPVCAVQRHIGVSWTVPGCRLGGRFHAVVGIL